LAIDPTAPIAPMIPAQPVGDAADQAKALLALARAAVANNASVLGTIAGGVTHPDQAPATSGPVANPSAPPAADAGGQLHADAAASVATPTPPTPPSGAERMAAAVRSAAAQAAPRQASLAPMMANLDTVIARPETPEPVRQAARQVLEKALPTSQPVTASALRQAVQGSGVFLEARMARAATEATAPRPTVPESAGGDMKAALLVLRAVVSTWLAKAPGVAPAPPTAPGKSVSDAEPGPSAAAPPMTPPGRPQGVYGPGQGLNAGTVARTAEPMIPETPEEPSTPLGTPTPMTGAAPSAPATAAIGVATPPADEEVAEAPAQEPAEEAVDPPSGQIARSAPPPVPTSARQPLLMVGLIEDELPEVPPSTSEDEEAPLPPPRGAGYAAAGPPRTPSSRPPPPYAGGPTTAQPATKADLPGDLSPADVARRLLKDVGGAIARQELSQIASLPEARHEPERAAEAKSSRWVFDLPFQTPQGVAVAQFEINKDGGGGSDGGREVERTWRARFSLDVEPLGPVHVQVALTGAMTRVGLWAERPESMARLRAGEEALCAALRQVELTPEIAVHSGAPTTALTAPGRFVDRAS
jgi:hypothetical protein